MSGRQPFASFETRPLDAPQDDDRGGLHNKARHAEEARSAVSKHAELAPQAHPAAHIVTLARTWIGTPYRHQGSTLHAGCDCLGLIRGVWRALYGAEPQTPPAYRPDWAETLPGEPMLEAARRWLIPREVGGAEPGDVLLFRMSPTAAIKHCAILSALPTEADPHPRMIHAYWGRAVCESWVGPWWGRRVAGAFAFPAASPPLPSPCPLPAGERVHLRQSLSPAGRGGARA